MAKTTVSSMHDARDAEDTRLLEAGEKTLLLESYYGVILDRCRLKLRDPEAAIEVAHEVVARLLSELARGRRYRVPFRVVVHKVIEWKVKEHLQQGTIVEVGLEEWLALASSDSSAELDASHGFESFLTGLTALEQEVLTLRYVHDLDFGEIGRRLGRTANAVHQTHFRALSKLRHREAAA